MFLVEEYSLQISDLCLLLSLPTVSICCKMVKVEKLFTLQSMFKSVSQLECHGVKEKLHNVAYLRVGGPIFALFFSKEKYFIRVTKMVKERRNKIPF